MFPPSAPHPPPPRGLTVKRQVCTPEDYQQELKRGGGGGGILHMVKGRSLCKTRATRQRQTDLNTNSPYNFEVLFNF